MGKAIQGAAMIGAALAMGTAAFFDPMLIALPGYAELMTSLAIGGISMEAGAIADALTQNRGTNITIRQPAAFRQIVYGERRVGGTLIYTSTTGSKHDQYNAVIVLASHEVDSIVGMYIDGRKVYFQGSGVGHCVRNGVSFGGIADSANHVGPGGATYNFGGTGHAGIYVEARFGDQTDPAGSNLPGNATWTGTPTSVIGGLTANDPAWDADGLGNYPWLAGCCYVYVKLEYNPDLFPGGPAQAELKFAVRGKNDIWDPRTGERKYTTNWALIIADLLTDTNIGLGDIDSVNEAQLIAAANVCEEMVPLANGSTERRYDAHWAYETSTASGDALQNLMNAAMGRLVRVGAEWFIFPAYWQDASFDFDAKILSGPVEWLPYRKLRELGNRVNGTYIAPNVPYNNAGNLYNSNGWYEGTILNNFPFGYQPTSFPQMALDAAHGYANDSLLEADSGVKGPWDSGTVYDEGDAVTESGVIFRSLLDANFANDPATHSAVGGSAAGLYAGGATYAADDLAVYNGPAYASGTTYAAGVVVSYSGRSYVSLVSSNVGNQPDISPTDWAVTVTLYRSLVSSNVGNQPDISPTDWAPVVWAKWSNVLPLELDLNCVISVGQAQRLAKIMLMRNRQQGSGTFRLKLDAWRAMPLDVMRLTFDEMGFVSKVLEVASTRFFLEQQDGGAQVIQFEAQLQEASPDVYNWSIAEELPVQGPTSNPTSMPWGLDAPSGVTATSSSSTAILGTDGVNHPRILIAWTSSPDARATQIQGQYKLHSGSTWIDAGAVDASSSAMYVGGVISGSVYDVRIRAIGPGGASSDWVEVDNVTASAPNSLQASYSNVPQFPLTNPTSTTIAIAATAVTFGNVTVNYAARTKTISAPGTATWYYLTIADPTQAGESGSPTLTVTASTTTSLVGVQGNTYLGAIFALPAGGGTTMIPGGWPAPTGFQVVG